MAHQQQRGYSFYLYFVSASESTTGFNQIEIDGYVDSTERKNLILSVNLIGEFDIGSTRHTFVTGVEYIDTSSDQDRFNTLWDANGDDQIFVDVVEDRFEIDDGRFDVRGLEIEGFEVQFQGRVTEQIHFVAGYSHLDGKTDDGAELPRELPENTFSTWINFDVTIGEPVNTRLSLMGRF